MKKFLSTTYNLSSLSAHLSLLHAGNSNTYYWHRRLCRMFVRNDRKFRRLERPKRWIIGCETVSSGHSNFPNLTNFLIGDTSERITENTWHENSIESQRLRWMSFPSFPSFISFINQIFPSDSHAALPLPLKNNLDM